MNLKALIALVPVVAVVGFTWADVAATNDTGQPDEASQESPAPGSRFQDCPKCPEMVIVPAGSYRMGSLLWEGGRRKYEGPRHEVVIAVPFAIGRYEVTVAEFGWFVDETGYSAGNHWRSPGFDQNVRHPVVGVSWEDARAYVAWLSWKFEEEYHLPSESEWEYAARAGTETVYSWGNEIGVGRATCIGCGSQWVRRTAPVGSFAANAWGLHDMHGNVWEWTRDCWKRQLYGSALGRQCVGARRM